MHSLHINISNVLSAKTSCRELIKNEDKIDLKNKKINKFCKKFGAFERKSPQGFSNDYPVSP